jgi:hypothetical protein
LVVPRLVLFLLALRLAAQDRLTPQEERGRQIYEHGVSPSGGAIDALIAGDSRVSGSVLPCVNCHGRDGLGKPEGGVTPSVITWDALTKPYGQTRPDGRVHAAYTEHLLKRAITMGIDSSGNTLGIAMPRFQLSSADASDLVAYIKRLGDTLDPGLTAATVRLGVLTPASRSADAGAITRQALRDYFDRLNAEGGIFSRRVDLIFDELPANSSQQADAVRDFLRKEQVFAVLGDFTGAESAIAAVMRETGTPAIPAIDPFPDTSLPINNYVFYLDGGLKDEVEALADYAAKRFPRPDIQTVIVSSSAEITREAASRLRDRLRESGRRKVVITEDEPAPDADLAFWFRSDRPVPRPDRKTVFLVPAYFGAADSLMRLTWDRLTASAAIISEAMRIAGRDLSRASLIAALEGFQSVQTTLPDPVSFGPDRRVGVNNVRFITFEDAGAKVVTVTHERRN